MKKLAVLLMILLLPASPVLGQSKKEKKKQAAALDFENMQKLINSKTYVFVADWANTFEGRRINLTANPNHLKIMNDSADIFLPYFGVGHSTNNYKTGDGGITFEGKLEDYKVDVNDKKQTLTIQLKARNKNELFEFNMLVYKSGNTNINVNSSGRSGIKYDGKTTAPKK